MAIAAIWLAAVAAIAQGGAEPLEARLRAEGAASLAEAARVQGDPARGASLFARPYHGCVACHEVEAPARPIGPELATIGRETTDEALVESILDPSRTIRQGFETVTIARADGSVATGLLGEDRPDAIVLRDPSKPGELVAIPKAEIDERRDGGPSVMPAGLANLLGGRQDFLDLIAYLRAIADGGPARALALRPDPSSIATPVAEYEADVDHARLIAGLGPEAMARGEAIYGRACATCHGTKAGPGSMPTSLRFASGAFKNGSDPYSMYRTLTHGHGQMPPQSWMVPRQKYDAIHYVREAYLKGDNPSQYARVDPAYLATLPAGSTLGPEPVAGEPWSAADLGPSLMLTAEVGDSGANIATKGIAVRLDPGPGGIWKGRAWALYEHDTLRLAGAWSGDGFIDGHGINFDGRHQVHPRVVGRVHLSDPGGPAWADPRTGTFADPRPLGRDGRPYGPLPRDWARYRGLHRSGDRVVMAYDVGATPVLDSPGAFADPGREGAWIFTRTLEVGPSAVALTMRAAPAGVAVSLAGDGAELSRGDGPALLRFPPSESMRRVCIYLSDGDQAALDRVAIGTEPPEPLAPLTRGGPGRWPEVLTTRATIGRDDGPFAVDTLTHPAANPWNARMRFAGFDFLDDTGRSAALCDWDGDVWIVEGLRDPTGLLRWRRIAAGLFQPLGLKVVGGRIFVGCRDQIAILDDRDGDGETDFVACFNTDHQVTEHFHEFAMDLQVDAEGNFYYAKAARHALPAVVPQHGTLLKVSRDGERTEILATGFRAPNGVCPNPDGTFFVSDQEGHWIPKNRINHVRVGKFYGNMMGYHDVTDPSDAAMEPPLCWITNAMDRSPAQLLRVPEVSWGPLGGSLLSLSYGYGKIFVVPHESVGGRLQGGVCALPIARLPTGVMRGRFGPADGQLYACGLFGWAGNQEQPGGLYRIRATGRPPRLPVGLSARADGLEIRFTDPVDPATAADPARYSVRVWGLDRTADYGSEHRDERPLAVRGATISDDGRRVLLDIEALAPTWCMEVAYALRAADGEPIEGTIHNTIHRLAPTPAPP